MSFDLQEHIAARVRLRAGRGPRALPVERFMRDYYRHARAILNSSSLVMEQCLARVRAQAAPAPRARRRGGACAIADGQLEIPHARQLRRDPLLLLRAFAVAQRHDVPLSRKARRAGRARTST